MTRPTDPDQDKHPASIWARMRGNFLTGLVVVAPLYLTVWLTWSFVSLIDDKVARLIPEGYNLQDYLNIPGYGLLVFVAFTALMGAIAKNFFAAKLIEPGERLLDRLPIVRSIYNGIKQIAETVLVQSKTSFKKACLIEYPRKGLYAIAFISTNARGEVLTKSGRDDLLSVFLPTTPNPTSGFLLFVPRADVIELDMSIEEAAKLIISAGLVAPEEARKVVARKPSRPLAPAAE
ncbi:MAG: hypothetical protein CVT86_07760 [Alphaproteobacteria bacterium HGW-Alphaproteobacteria-8]|nr:MAG: hypothetical protein CVT86_07760 [Alphaproteobacteria bacterium HGW-Alphaproteobacteria-8]